MTSPVPGPLWAGLFIVPIDSTGARGVGGIYFALIVQAGTTDVMAYS